MPAYIALLRAVNVGGTGKLPMAELRTLCEGLGFEGVRTYIQSGNVVLRAEGSPEDARARMESALEARMGGGVTVHVRTPAEIEDVLTRNPFPEAAPNRLLVFFVDEIPKDDVLQGLAKPAGERIAASGREMFVHYPNGLGRSKLKVPFAATATGRNLNTVRKLLDLGRAAEAEAG